MSAPEKPSFGKRVTKSAKIAPRETIPDPNDKRELGRAAAFKNAKLILRNNSVIECITRNVSDKGCLISAVGAENLPDEVCIRLSPLSEPLNAKVVWRDKGEAGLEFLKKP